MPSSGTGLIISRGSWKSAAQETGTRGSSSSAGRYRLSAHLSSQVRSGCLTGSLSLVNWLAESRRTIDGRRWTGAIQKMLANLIEEPVTTVTATALRYAVSCQRHPHDQPPVRGRNPHGGDGQDLRANLCHRTEPAAFARMTEGPLPIRERPLNVNLRRNPALSAISKTPGDSCGFTA
jgi:hypothetical protein